jgi:5-methylcytosine-specific restriction endonuclease McrA
MRDMVWDQPKSIGQMKKELGKCCSVPGCGKPLTHMQGPGSGVLCREDQLKLVEYGGMGRIDRPHTFHRKWICSKCGYDSLADPRLADIKDEMTKRRVARVLMHGDHQERQADGGNDSAENVRALCFVCHAKKTILNEDYRKNSGKNPIDNSVN